MSPSGESEQKDSNLRHLRINPVALAAELCSGAARLLRPGSCQKYLEVNEKNQSCQHHSQTELITLYHMARRTF